MRGMSCPVSASSCGTSSGLNLADTVQTICVLLTDTNVLMVNQVRDESFVCQFFHG